MKKYFVLYLLGSIVLGLLFPFGEKIKFILPFLLSILLFFNFLEIDINLKKIFRIEILYFFIIGLGIIPFLVYISTLKFDIYLRVGFLLIAIAPTAIGSSIIVRLVGGRVDISVFITIISNFLSIFYYPILLKLYFGNNGITISLLNIFTTLLLVIIVPFLFSLIIKQFSLIVYKLKVISNYVYTLFVVIVYIAISSARGGFKQKSFIELVTIFAITTLIAGVYYLSGFFLSKNLETKKSLMSTMGQKNTGLCIWIAISNFSPITAIPATIYVVVHHLINSLLLIKFKNKNDTSPKP